MTALADRAATAERAIRDRHLRRVWGLPGTVLGRSGWPPSTGQRVHWHWNYWWQAHLLDTLVDAQLRKPSPERLKLIDRFVVSVRLRNFGKWINDYYDDIAWLGLALQRAGHLGLDVRGGLEAISSRLREGWTDDAGGGIWWRVGDDFKNAPANGPAAIFHAREGSTQHARGLTDWMTERLVDPESGLVWDGLRVGSGELVKHIFTYCQGVYLGACLELSEMDRVEHTIHAVAEHVAPNGVIRGQEGGDGGLFGGILARYLALAAPLLPSGVARDLVIRSADACWSGATETPHGPLFSADWATPAPSLPLAADAPERDLSVQVSAWMLLEAAATLEHPPRD
ncbi:glycoside hydrolase family 76 protein [Amycolatopsis sp. EV170708-02-1]|uniref:glycoside hydrolase family 76 protein n=1 Tax=Amycolatopsis sp. EV170708-02-1 TaxID=2919322 RepID=UPI001F0B9175|nr:glycoside hydrolase family 76 protein [Amycolatopsis sp. EV170708-02-1]UMP03041.1 fructose-bisphosphate aldolase [Amycolatopsis sp. EV170708-02-1]